MFLIQIFVYKNIYIIDSSLAYKIEGRTVTEFSKNVG